MIVMQEEYGVVRIGTSPMTPAQLLTDLWTRIHERCGDVSFQLVPFENTPENVREILRNLGENIDVVTVIGKWSCVHPMLKVLPVAWYHAISFGILHPPAPPPMLAWFLDAVRAVAQENGENG